MLKHTFCHIPRVGVKTEARLWDAGVADWDALHALETAPCGRFSMTQMRDHLTESRVRLEAGDAAWFADRLPSAEVWRVFPPFAHSAAYVDIETTGLGHGDDHITSIALWDGRSVRTYVHGDNLEDFVEDIAEYAMVVTFNGRCFDVPFIERSFGISMPHAHMDLRFVLGALGIKGGLKRIEHHFGLDRGGLEGVDGYDAVLLWQAWKDTGDQRFLDTLVAYNIEDVLSLEVLAAQACNLHLANTPFANNGVLPIPTLGLNPIAAHPDALRKARARVGRPL